MTKCYFVLRLVSALYVFQFKLFSNLLFIFQNFKILSFYFFKKSTFVELFSKTFCDWYLPFRGGTGTNQCGTLYLY